MRRFGLAAVMILGACNVEDGSMDRTLVLENATGELIGLGNHPNVGGVIEVAMQVDGNWEPLLASDNCLDICGKPTTICAMPAMAPGLYALPDGDFAEVELPARMYRQFGDCFRETSVVGELRIDVCYQQDLTDMEGQPIDPIEQGFIDSADASDSSCQTEEFSLDDTNVELDMILELEG